MPRHAKFSIEGLLIKAVSYSVPLISMLLIACTSSAKDNQQLFNELTEIAKAGNPEAQYHLGMLYNNGIGTVKDISQAFLWFEKSADAGDPLGHYKVGCYYSGQAPGVVSIDEEKALKHKLVAAENGYALAQFDVAVIYYRNKDFVNAIKWWERAADQGLPDAVYALFSVYDSGKEIDNDVAKAYGYLKIIERNIDEKSNEKIKQKLKALKFRLSEDQLAEAESFTNAWKPHKSPLTVKAFDGIDESRRIVKNYKEGISSK